MPWPFLPRDREWPPPPRASPSLAEAFEGEEADPPEAQQRDAYRDKVSVASFASMRQLAGRAREPLVFMKVIHLGRGRLDFEAEIERMGVPMVRGTPFTEGNYYGFSVGVDIEEMCYLLRSVGNTVRGSDMRNRERGAETRIRLRFQPFAVSVNSTTLPILEEFR